MTTKLTRPNRRKERGAALVEAALVIPVMVVFLGLIMFTHRSYDVKMDKQLGTRAGTLFYASHACKGDIPADVVPSLDDADPGLPGSAADKNAGKIGGSNSAGATAAVKRSNNLVKAQPKPTDVTGKAVQNGKTFGLSRPVSAASEVACNEEVFKSKWTAVFKEIGSLYKSKGGLVD
jgi:hypothetical protein